MKKSRLRENASRRNRVHGRKRDDPNRPDVQPRQSHAHDMRFVRSVSGRSSVERSHLGGVELAAEEDVSHSAARLDDRRQTPREDRRRKNVQVFHAIADQLLFGNHADAVSRGRRGHSTGERNKNGC